MNLPDLAKRQDRRTRAMRRLYDWMGGKSIAFAMFFAAAGTALAAFHKLDLSYAALVTSIQGFIVARSIAQDRYPPITPAQSLDPPKPPPPPPPAAAAVIVVDSAAKAGAAAAPAPTAPPADDCAPRT